jgi:pentatricopeptide repeat protein
MFCKTFWLRIKWINAIFGICFAAGNMNQARFIYDNLIELGLKPDDWSVASLIMHYGQNMQLELAWEIFDSVSELSSLVGGVVLKAMIDALCTCGNIDEAYSLYNDLVHLGCNRDAVTISILVNALTKSGNS